MFLQYWVTYLSRANTTCWVSFTYPKERVGPHPIPQAHPSLTVQLRSPFPPGGRSWPENLCIDKEWWKVFNQWISISNMKDNRPLKSLSVLQSRAGLTLKNSWPRSFLSFSCCVSVLWFSAYAGALCECVSLCFSVVLPLYVYLSPPVLGMCCLFLFPWGLAHDCGFYFLCFSSCSFSCISLNKYLLSF